MGRPEGFLPCVWTKKLRTPNSRSCEDFSSNLRFQLHAPPYQGAFDLLECRLGVLVARRPIILDAR